MTAAGAASGATRPRIALVLGAGPLQAPLIRAAAQRGLRVVSVDNVPGNVGHRFAHASHDLSTRDVAGVVALARELAPAAVLTAASDLAVPAVAAACAALGLPGPSPALAEAWCRKDAFRAFQRAHGLAHPDFVAGDAPAELAARARTLSGAVVVKPVDRSGSRGVSTFASAGDPGIAHAIARALGESFAKRAIVEQAIPGIELGGDAVVVGDVLHAFLTHKQMDGPRVRGHRMPPSLSAPAQASVRAAVQAHAAAAGLRGGVVNFDVMLRPDGAAVVIEMSPRLGGNWIPELARQVWGVDLFAAALAGAVGEPVRLDVRPAPRPAGSYVFGSPRAGRVRELPALAELRARVPQLAALEWDVAIGARVAPMRDSAQQLGRALLDCAEARYEDGVAALERALAACLELDPDEAQA